MAKEKKINLKKIFTDINEIGKNLSSSGNYIIDFNKNLLIATYVKNYSMTYNVAFASLDAEYTEYLPYLGNCVNGVELARALKGTGVNVELFDDYTMKVESEVKVKDVKEQYKWTTGQNIDEIWRYHTLANFDKYERKINKMKKIYKKDETLIHSEYDLDLDNMDYKSKFVMDLRHELNVAMMRITNKTLKNYGKDTTRIHLMATKYLDPDKTINKERLLFIDIENPYSVTHIIHGFADR